tara:strand:- start:142 stop:942 length:801 start_codon:yes stop_codon:yes gene_type:complete
MISNDNIGNLGRLGNQMFQYASLLGIAKKHGYEYCLPPIEVFGVYDPMVVNSDINIFDCFNIPDVPRRITNFPKVMESTYALDNNIWDNCPDNVSLFGYFQSEKYFKHIENIIRDIFTFVDWVFQPTEESFKLNFDNTEVISLHIRRTDYINYSHHPVQGLDYYIKSLSQMPDDIPVMIFSDDIKWCGEQDIFQGDRFILSEGNNTAIDLCLQSLCTYHIIANSSFSWWGSWLAKSKKTIAPRNWFAGPDKDKDVSDLYLPQWVLL